MARQARVILERHHFSLDPSAPVGRLSRAEKQLVEIARALRSATRVVVMDEPTAVLSGPEANELFRIIGDLRARGLAIVYISHRMEELALIADRITILRDGKRVYTGPYESIDNSAIIRHMVGREIGELYPPRNTPRTKSCWRCAASPAAASTATSPSRCTAARSWASPAWSAPAARPWRAASSGSIRPGRVRSRCAVHSRSFPHCRDAIRSGFAYLTEDRKVTSLFPHLPLVHNISMAALDKVASGGVLRLREEARRCGELVRDLRIRARSEWDPVYRLSGGNQQKWLVARWLFAGSSVLLLDEPTQGVDLGARAEIYRLIAGSRATAVPS